MQRRLCRILFFSLEPIKVDRRMSRFLRSTTQCDMARPGNRTLNFAWKNRLSSIGYHLRRQRTSVVTRERERREENPRCMHSIFVRVTNENTQHVIVLADVYPSTSHCFSRPLPHCRKVFLQGDRTVPCRSLSITVLLLLEPDHPRWIDRA